MNKYSIIPATLEDATLIAEFIGELLDDFNLKSGANFNIDLTEIKTTCQQLLPRENFAAFIAIETLGLVPIGMITIAQATAIYNGGDFGVITELYVKKNYRSTGIGKLLINEAIAFAKSKHWKKVEVGAPSKTDWPRTIEFYKKNGFEEKGPKLIINILTKYLAKCERLSPFLINKINGRQERFRFYLYHNRRNISAKYGRKQRLQWCQVRWRFFHDPRAGSKSKT